MVLPIRVFGGRGGSEDSLNLSQRPGGASSRLPPPKGWRKVYTLDEKRTEGLDWTSWRHSWIHRHRRDITPQEEVEISLLMKIKSTDSWLGGVRSPGGPLSWARWEPCGA